MRFVMSYSGGKDSALALYRMIKAGHEPLFIMTTINPQQGRSWFHGISLELLTQVSQSLSIPLLPCVCKPEAYTQTLEDCLAKARDAGAEAAVFGDIDIAEHRQWNEERCRNLGLSCVLPLWQEDREALVGEALDAGFQAVIKIIRLDSLDATFLGQTLSPGLVEGMKALGCDPCGENGEYHTFVYDGPIFSRPVPIKIGDRVDLGTHQAVEISLCQK